MSSDTMINDYFSEHIDSFTIYVVEQKFAVNQGKDYFKQFSNNEHLINSNSKMKQHLSKMLNWIQKKIPDVAELTKNVISTKTAPSPSGIDTYPSKALNRDSSKAAMIFSMYYLLKIKVHF